MNMKYASVIVLLGLATQVLSNGMVTDPPNRSSMWRYGYDYPPNYSDDSNFCGGFSVQWDQNDGKCGLCGDDWASPQPRSNEHGGYYGLGVIPEKSHYIQGGVLVATINLTVSHLGHFEFSICKMETDNSESEECFAKYPLALSDGSTMFEILSQVAKTYYIALRLPADLFCDHCVFRWHYKTGNSLGDCGNGEQGLGCGPQETYRTCSDIAIRPRA